MALSLRKKILYIVVLAIVIGLMLASSSFLQGFIGSSLESLTAFNARNPIFGPFLFVLLAALSILLGPFSSVPLVPFATHIWGATHTLVLLFTGWILGNAIAYGLGRYLGQPLVSKIVGSNRLDEWRATIKARITFYFMLLFRVATPSETGYIFGLIHYPFSKYLFLTILAETPFALLAVYASQAVAQSSWWTLAWAGGAWVFLVILAGKAFQKTRKRIKEQPSQASAQ